MNRRQFGQQVAATAAAFSTPMVARASVRGANEEILVGVIGLGGRGRGAHVPSMQNQEGVTVVAVSDPDRPRMDSAAEIIRAKSGRPVHQYADMREMFDRKDIDVISNATQNYWHGLSTIWACQAGKHVYVEKPLSHYIWEGRQMVNAARKYDRIVQCGTQRRSQTSIADAIQWIHEGHLGKIRYITAFDNKRRSSCGRRDTPLEIPETLDFELWCGPAKKVPIYRNRLQYDCSFDWNTGDGESVNQGVHEIDAARWCLGETALPRRVLSMGGRFVFDDACNTPNTQITYYDYPTAPLLYEVHNLTVSEDSRDMPAFRGEGVGVIVHCEGGEVSLYRGIAWDHERKEVQRFSGSKDHFVNFISAVRSGNREQLNAEVEVGQRSTSVCHAGNISYRVGERASESSQRSAIRDCPLFCEMHDRFLTHLEAHGIDPDTVTLGPWLEIDTQRECFKDHAAANELVRGSYRAPFVVPEVVV
jgi:predicted dehydrogenase